MGRFVTAIAERAEPGAFTLGCDRPARDMGKVLLSWKDVAVQGHTFADPGAARRSQSRGPAVGRPVRRSALPEGGIVVLPGQGHMAQAAAPELVANAVIRFITEPAGS